MSERVIAIRRTPTLQVTEDDGVTVTEGPIQHMSYYEPDPDAPSLSEVVGILRAAKCPDGGCDGEGATWNGPDEGGGYEPSPCQWCDERQDLIARLEGE